jgi:hypothetical protein
VAARLKDILPAAYFHIVFTLPHSLNGLTQYNKRIVYDLLMASSSQTLLTFGRDRKWLGGKIGFYGILHTWGQRLWLHPHVHYIVAGGALSADGRWIEPKYKDKFLFPVKALSKVFRGKFIEGLKAAYYQRKLVIPDDYSELSRPDLFEHWINDLVSCQWVVYCKPPLADAEKIVRYLGRYTHRVAISNRRIFGIKNGRIYFWYKNYCSDRITWQQMSLSCKEFIRRFLEHVLPEGYHKIRHYGIFANGRCKIMVHQIRNLLNVTPVMDHNHNGNYKRHCSVCTIGLLNINRVIIRWGRMAISSTRLKSSVHAFDTS